VAKHSRAETVLAQLEARGLQYPVGELSMLAAVRAVLEAASKLTVDEQFWLDNRVAIIDALTEKGLQIVSNADRVWLAPLPHGVDLPDGGQRG
jgi:hypothetical protein